MKTSSSAGLHKALGLLEAVIADRGQRPIGVIAQGIGLPRSTAYRLAGVLIDQGCLVECGRGRYLPGLSMIASFAQIGPNTVFARVAAPILNRAAKQAGHLVQMGVLEGGMVTYLVKAGESNAAHFTREGMQLEAYCSGLGKVLLAHLPTEDLRLYLAGSPLVSLTRNTIIDPRRLEEHLQGVRTQGYAIDDREVAENLKCIAAPLFDDHGIVRAAISLSARPEKLDDRQAQVALARLRSVAEEIRCKLYGFRADA